MVWNPFTVFLAGGASSQRVPRMALHGIPFFVLCTQSEDGMDEKAVRRWEQRPVVPPSWEPLPSGRCLKLLEPFHCNADQPGKNRQVYLVYLYMSTPNIQWFLVDLQLCGFHGEATGKPETRN